MSYSPIPTGSRISNRAAAARDGSPGQSLPLCVRTSPSAAVRLLDAIDAGESSFVITALGGAVSVRAQLVRSHGAEIEYGSLSVDWSRGTVATESGRVTLSRTELRLLAVLVEGQGAIIDNEQLLKKTWPARPQDSTAVQLLHVYVHSLRHRLAGIGAASRLQAAPGEGYKFTL